MEHNTAPLVPEKIAGFECETFIENMGFQLSMNTVAFLPNAPIQFLPHNHPVFEAHLLVSGKADMVTPNGDCRLQKNDLCILPPRLYHSAKEIEGPVSSIAFSFSYRRLDNRGTTDLFSEFDRKLSVLDTPLFLEQVFPLAHALFDLTEEMGRHLVGKEDRLKHKTATVALGLIDLVCPDLRGEYTDNLSDATRQRLRIDQFFALNYAKDITVKDLADAIFLSERHTNRVLSDLYHCSFKQKLIETRIQTAMQRLQSTKLSVSEIAEQSGYHSAVGFHTAFRQVCGMTPAKYRAKFKK